MKSPKVCRVARIPDPVRINRYLNQPQLGPSVLFFSGGSALNDTSRVLKRYTHNSIHLVTPFDSGGSSAELRKTFGMPSIGDLRSRMMALADESLRAHPETGKLFNYRFPMDARPLDLAKQLTRMANGHDPLVKAIENPMRKLIRNHLGYFLDRAPDDFELRGASVGNLILAGGYLNNREDLDPIVYLFSKLVNVQGQVRTTVNEDLHLAATLENTEQVSGQHRLTGKEVPPIRSPIRSLFLTEHLEDFTPVSVKVTKKNAKLIRSADLIVYPPGSFYTSLIANLLPKGVGRAVAANHNPKVYIPNQGQDPEQKGMNLNSQIQVLLQTLRTDVGEDVPNHRLLNFVMIDSRKGDYPVDLDQEQMASLGVEIIDTALINELSAPYYDQDLLVAALLSLT